MLILNRLRFILSVLLLLAFAGTIHMSRHSFSTSVCLSQGVPIETLSQMLGHQDIATTQIYAEITHTKINEDMTNLAERIQGKYELPENSVNKFIARQKSFSRTPSEKQ
jgi:integrase